MSTAKQIIQDKTIMESNIIFPGWDKDGTITDGPS